MNFRIMRLRTRAGWLPALGLAAVSACSEPAAPPTEQVTPGDAEVTGLRALAQGVTTPFDGTPDPTGERVIFTTLGTRAEIGEATIQGLGAGNLMITPKSGGAATMLADGFAAPVQVVSSLDGTKVYVADLAAEQRADDGSSGEGKRGVIYSVAIPGGGDKIALEGTRGYQPRGLDVAKIDGKEWLYFVGRDPADGVFGVFRTENGTSVEMVKKGAPLLMPSCLAVAANGDIYLTDLGGEERAGAVLKLSGDSAEVLVGQLNLGTPAGLALSESEKVLLVSALRPANEGGTSVVQRIELATVTVAAFDDGIKTNFDSAGLHRAHNADLFAWSNAGQTGTVFLVGTKKNPLP